MEVIKDGKGVIRGKVEWADDPSSWQLEELEDSFQIKGPESFIHIQNKHTYPEFFATRQERGFLFGYKDPKSIVNSIENPPGRSQEYLLLEVKPKEKILVAETDYYTGLQFYFLLVDNTLLFSSNFVDLLRAERDRTGTVKIDTDVLLNKTTFTPSYNHTTLSVNIQKVLERETWKYHDNKLKINLPDPEERKIVRRKIKDNSNFVKKFGDLLDRKFEQVVKQINPEVLASDMSGGIDSAVTTIGLSQFTQPIDGIAQIVPKETGEQPQQLEALQAAIDTYPLNLHKIYQAEYPTLGDIANLNLEEIPLYNDFFNGPHYNMDRARNPILNKINKSVVINGFGGDELMAPKGDYDPREENWGLNPEEIVKRREKGQFPFPNFLNPELKNRYLNEEQIKNSWRQIPPYTSSSAVDVTKSLNGIMTSKGYWSYAPLIDPDLWDYVRNIPDEAIRNKEFLRQYLKLKNAPDKLTDAPKHGTLMAGVTQGLQKALPTIKNVMSNSILEEKGIINADKVLAATKQEIELGQSLETVEEWHKEHPDIAVVPLIMLEITLQKIESKYK